MDFLIFHKRGFEGFYKDGVLLTLRQIALQPQVRTPEILTREGPSYIN